MQGMKYVVRWKDADGNNQRKEYERDTDAKKAHEWLLKNGATDVDFAVNIAGRDQSTVFPGAKTTPAPPPQPDLWHNK